MTKEQVRLAKLAMKERVKSVANTYTMNWVPTVYHARPNGELQVKWPSDPRCEALTRFSVPLLPKPLPQKSATVWKMGYYGCQYLQWNSSEFSLQLNGIAPDFTRIRKSPLLRKMA